MTIQGMELGGTAWTFTGNVDENIVLTRGLVLANLPPCSPGFKLYQRMVPPTYPPLIVTKGDIIQTSQLLINQYLEGILSFDTNMVYWWYAIAALRPELVTADPNAPNSFGMWAVFAKGARQLLGPTSACIAINENATTPWEKEDMFGTWFGFKPFQSEPVQSLLCPIVDLCQIQATFRGNVQQVPLLGVESRLQWFILPDTYVTIFLDFADDDGGFAMPLPPIPEGFPLPPPVYGIQDPCDCVGPQGPPGPPGDCSGCLRTAQDVAAAFADPSTQNSTKQLMGEATRTFSPFWAGDYLPALEAVAAADLKAGSATMINNAPDYYFPEPKLRIVEGATPQFHVIESAENLLEYELILPAAVLLALNLLTQTLITQNCNVQPDGSNVLQPRNISFPAISIDTFTQAEVFQAILDKLDHLLRCCPPCATSPWVRGPFFLHEPPEVALAQVITCDSLGMPPGWCFDEVEFDSFNQEFPVDTTFSAPDIVLAGKFHWVYADGTVSDVSFINLRTQSKFAPNGFAIGFGLHLNPGISCGWQYKASPRPANFPW